MGLLPQLPEDEEEALQLVRGRGPSIRWSRPQRSLEGSGKALQVRALGTRPLTERWTVKAMQVELQMKMKLLSGITIKGTLVTPWQSSAPLPLCPEMWWKAELRAMDSFTWQRRCQDSGAPGHGMESRAASSHLK